MKQGIFMTSNDLDQVSIGGKLVGTDDNSTNISINIEAVEQAKPILYDLKIIEAFAMNAQRYIGEVAQVLDQAFDNDDKKKDMGLDEKKIKKKFTDMKCSNTLINDYDQMSEFFHVIDSMVKTDAVAGGAASVKRLIENIIKLYTQFLETYDSGDKIHNAIVVELMKRDNHKFFISANIFTFYVIRECGIFNEQK